MGRKNDIERRYPLMPKPYPVPQDLQCEVLSDLAGQYFACMETALKKQNALDPLAIMLRALAITESYVKPTRKCAGFDQLSPFANGLRRDVLAMKRLLRRILIERALTCPQETFEETLALIRKLERRGHDACEFSLDMICVQRHLRDGSSLIDDLKRDIQLH